MCQKDDYHSKIQAAKMTFSGGFSASHKMLGSFTATASGVVPGGIHPLN